MCHGDPSTLPTYTPDYLDKMILVHYKHFPNVASVPKRVTQGLMNQAKSKARIKFANVMIVGTIFGCILTVVFAKTNSRQNSLVEENMKRHLMYKKGETGGAGRLGLITSKGDEKEGEKEE